MPSSQRPPPPIDEDVEGTRTKQQGFRALYTKILVRSINGRNKASIESDKARKLYRRKQAVRIPGFK
ncbi:unnamed protein product [Amaranthus hypochondriacus]